MKRLSLLSVCFLASTFCMISSCQKNITQSDTSNRSLENQPDYRLNDIWILQSIDGQPVRISAKQPTLEINLKENRTFGQAGCNTFRGNVTVDNQFVTFGPLAATKMMCPDMNTQNQYLALLSEGVFRYKVEPNPATLTLIKNEHNLYFKKGD